jgi:hypothetical protein
MFTTENTEGFTAAQIADLNDALAALKREFPEVDEANLHDMINNAWFEGISPGHIVVRVSERLS